MAAHEYIVGQVVLLRARLSDPATGDPDDPATQTAVDDATDVITVYKPDGTTITPSVTHTGLGTYTAEVDLDIPGWWFADDASTGLARGRGKDRFYVAPFP